MSGYAAAVEGVPNYEPRSMRARTVRRNRNANANATTTVAASRPTSRKRARRPAAVREFTLADSTHYISEVSKLPMYLVNGHACLCHLGGGCYVPGSSALFTLPIDTYIQSFVIPEEFFCLRDPEQTIVDEKDDIRRMLYIHSASDIELSPAIGESRLSLLSQMKRATGGTFDGERLVYPNVAFTFNEFKDEHNKTKPHTLAPRAENKYGVYRIDQYDPSFDGATLNNTMSIIPQDASRPGDTWFLEDIIQEVKRKEGVRKAIFVLTGCFNQCKKPPRGDINRLQTIVELAHNAFNTLKPTVEKREGAKLKASNLIIPYNVGSNAPSTALTVREVLAMRELTDPELYLTELAFMLDREDRELLHETLKKEKAARPAKKGKGRGKH